MVLDLNDPSSIVAWWKVLPERHGSQLLAFGRLRPQFRGSKRTAIRRIKDYSGLSEMIARYAWVERNEARFVVAEDDRFNAASTPQSDPCEMDASSAPEYRLQ